MDGERVWMLGPGVELQSLARLRDEASERGRRDRVGSAPLAPGRACGRGLAGPYECLRAPSLEARVARRGEPRIGSGADDPAARVELRRKEGAEVRLVPDSEEADERIAGEPC